MAIGTFSGEIDLSITSSTFERQAGGGARVAVNLEGQASGFGRVTGTLSLLSSAPGAVGGPASYTGAAFLDSGDIVGSIGEGTWQKLGAKQQWRVRGITTLSTGGVLATDATLDLASRSYRGTFAEWS